MSAVPAGVLFVSTLPDPANPSQTLIRLEIDYNNSTGALTGGSATNNGTKPIPVTVSSGGTVLRTVTVPRGLTTFTAGQLAANGFNTAADCNGLTFSL